MENRKLPAAGEFYRHFKDKLYQIVTIAKHSETGEAMVVYQALYGDFGVYVRPLEMFMSEVDHEKYPQVRQRYRFERMEPDRQPEKDNRGIPEKVSEGQCAEEEKIRGEELAERADGVCEAPQILSGETAVRLLTEFLDADTYAEKLNILRGMKKHMDDKLANDVAVSLDIVLREEPLAEKISDLENCLKTYARFECNRFR